MLALRANANIIVFIYQDKKNSKTNLMRQLSADKLIGILYS